MIKKKFKQSLLVILVLFSYFAPVIVHAASYRGIVTGDSVNVRKGPGTNSDVLKAVSKNTQVDMVDTTKYSGTGCSEGWYRIYLPNTTTEGYICSQYLKIEEGVAVDKYLRPWMSPKQAIVGGAIFIGESYISKGQFTSYLKKFNVNPSGSYTVHTHQYMTNIRAPYSEAASVYGSYSKSGMINQALIFSIPVFNNMPAETTLYNYSRSNPGQTTVTDQDFEALLDAQKFPDHYKKYLRKIHNDYPNWIFEAMHTNIEWSTAVSKQKAVGAIDSTNTNYCEVQSNGSCLKTEAGWYRPTNAATAYFLDPRNFMDEKYILQFEKLSYSSNIKESDVAFVLNNTFMSGNSALDNQSYVSIFIEAGKTGNVNAVYLASLAKQEIGTTSGSATNGAMFTYEGITYQGLYNFFNIGAVSSASNPSRAGLVWASGGSSLPIVNTIETLELVVYADSNIGTFITEFKKELDKELSDYIISIVDKNNKPIADSGMFSTGSKITVTAGIETVIFKIAVLGDITGTGSINSADLLAIRQHLLGTSILKNEYLSAADTNQDNKVNSADLLALRQHLLGQKKLS